MKQFFRIGVPVVVVLACIVNFITAWNTENSLAMAGYITAIFGWLAVVHSEYVNIQIEKKQQTALDNAGVKLQ